MLVADGGKLEEVIGEVGGWTGFLRKDLFEHGGGMLGGGAFDGELEVGIFGVLHSEVNESFLINQDYSAS